MYGFLILLPLTLTSVVIGYLLLNSPQLSDYVDFLTQLNIPANKTKWEHFTSDWRLGALMASHFVAYFALCFCAIGTVRTVSSPLSEEKPAVLRALQLVLEATFVSIPSSVLLWICGRAILDDVANPLLWTMTITLAIGLVACVTLTVKRTPVELYGSSLDPVSITKTDSLALVIAILVGLVVIAFMLRPRDSATMVGMFPVLMLATASVLLLISAIFSRHGSPVAVVSSLITLIVFLNMVDQRVFSPREFRYSPVAWKAGEGDKTDAEAIKAQRQIPKLRTAFRDWLHHRRSAIAAYNANGRTFPIFFASAQGGGIYAAYHPALKLARLVDACPEFTRHLFGISSVSGGSLGAAVFAESVRALPAEPLHDAASAHVGCTSRGTTATQKTPVNDHVSRFFATDLLSPVVASALVFDVPSIFVPQIRFGHDRALALEAGIEVAWEKHAQHSEDIGMGAPFYARWSPSKGVPALFMTTTGVNFGVPVLISQVDFSRAQLVTRPKRVIAKDIQVRPAAEEPNVLKLVREQFAQSGETVHVSIANILDFRPDLQLAMSTAAVLSARFPFVSPPGVIKANAKINPSPLYRNTNYLELTDGGFYDNSGGVVAREIILELQKVLREPEFIEFQTKINFHWIRFTHTPARRQVAGNEGGNFELVAPIVAFEAVRQSRGAFQLSPPAGVAVTDLYLLDEWYEGSLNWLLSHGTKTRIEVRSSWEEGHENLECCLVRNLATLETRRIPLKKDELKSLQENGYEWDEIMPNATPLRNILKAVNDGLPLAVTAAQNQSP